MDKQKIFLAGFFGVIGVVVAFAFVSALSLYTMQPMEHSQQKSMPPMARMSLSLFDEKMAMQFMDMNGDGMCDACGMPVAICMDSGQIQCNMDPKSTIGVLGSRHIHADWKIYINGKALDEQFFIPIARSSQKTDSNLTSSFIHVEASSGEKVGDVLHMHATGVPIWMFFKSIGMNFNKDSLTLPDGRKFSNDGKNTLKFYVNGKLNNELENYVFSDGDKILISYGDGTGLGSELESITGFSSVH